MQVILKVILALLLGACSSQPPLLGTDALCIEKNSTLPLSVAEANGWKINRVLAATHTSTLSGEQKDVYVNFVEVPPSAFCRDEESQ